MRRTFSRQCPHCTRQVTWPDTPTYPFAPSVVSLSTWAPGPVMHIAFHANRWTQRKPGWKLMTLREKGRRSISHSTPGVDRDSFL